MGPRSDCANLRQGRRAVRRGLRARGLEQAGADLVRAGVEQADAPSWQKWYNDNKKEQWPERKTDEG